MRDMVWDRPSLARRYRERNRGRVYLPLEYRDLDDDTELAFHKVWLARQLSKLPQPERRAIHLPTTGASGIVADMEGLRSACGINPLPHRHPTA
jgi:hypothetical protein